MLLTLIQRWSIKIRDKLRYTVDKEDELISNLDTVYNSVDAFDMHI